MKNYKSLPGSCNALNSIHEFVSITNMMHSDPVYTVHEDHLNTY